VGCQVHIIPLQDVKKDAEAPKCGMRSSECGIGKDRKGDGDQDIRKSGYQGITGTGDEKLSLNAECEKIESYAEIMEKMRG
jgi:hypothetical protein